MKSHSYPPDDQFVAEYQELGTLAAMGERYGVSKNAVYLYISRRPQLQERIEQCRSRAAEQTSKRCPNCGETKPIEEFGWRPGGLYPYPYCRACRTQRSREKRQNPEYRAKQREYEQRPDVKHRDRIRRAATSHDVSQDALRSLWDRQHGECAICSKPLARYWAVDHCHDSGRVRGFVCAKCNVAIAQLGDTAESVMRAVNYLETPPGDYIYDS